MKSSSNAKGVVVFLLVSYLISVSYGYAETQTTPPGIVIDRSFEPASVYVGCPSIAILPNGSYVASHSWFGPKTFNNETVIFRSADKGEHWQKLCKITGQWWSSLFIVDTTLYIVGVNGSYGNVVIRRSDDGGHKWTLPSDATSGLLLKGKYHCAPVPVVIHKNRIWRAFEQNIGAWGTGFQPFVISAPVDADLLNADSWTSSNRLPWGDWKPYGGWLEGNVVVTPDGGLADILRVHEPKKGGKAAVVEISNDGQTLTFDPKKGFIDFPGGCKKFTIRHDPQSGLYWSLTNWEQDKDRPRAKDANYHRNTLALTTSKNLRDWEVRAIILYHPDVRQVGFQYADWQFEGDDIIAVARTAFGDAPNCHDANYLTFHRIKDFRNRTMDNKPLSYQIEERANQP